MFTEDTLAEKVIFITGGGSGLGLSMAKKFASLGASVAICGRTQEKLEKAASEIDEIGKGKATGCYVCDVRDYDQVKSTVDQIIADYGQLDGLVNNAAGNFLSTSEDLSAKGFKAVVDIVLHGSFNATHAFGNYLIDHERKGSVLSIVTTYAETGSGFVLPSACAKSGVLTMTKSLAFEWAHYGIRLNAIAPGPFPTEGAWQRLMPDPSVEKAYINKIPMKRYGDHEELANLATFLISDLAEYLTGECVTIDGGERLQAGQFNFVDQLASRENLKAMLKSMRG